MRFEPFLLLQLLVGYALASVCFLAGVQLHAWQFWVSFAVATGAAFYFSRKAGLWMLGINTVVFALTLYTFTYVHIDASICHLPMTHFMQDGWNPVRDSSIDAVRGCFAARGMPDVSDFTVLHVIAGPKFSQILAAQYQSAFGLFSAGGYPVWMMVFALAFAAFRFARDVWSVPCWISVAFAVLVSSNRIIAENSFFGLVDYVTYSSIALSALALGSWVRTKDVLNLAVFFAGLVIALTSKFNSIVCVGLLLVLAAYFGRKDRSMRIGLLVFFASLSFFCIIPYWTSACCHGSPIYPAHSFRDDVPLMDLTEDFIGNDDAGRMGYIARFVYAWVSRPLAEWGCRLWYSLDTFDPRWKYDFLTAGEPPLFCIVLWSGAVLSLILNRNRVTLIGWTLMLAFFLLPVKYIGYSRYVSYVFFIAALFWFNAFSSASVRFRGFLYVAPVVFALCMGWQFLRAYVKQIAAEAVLQENIGRLSEKGSCSYPCRTSYWWYALKHRLAVDGVELRSESFRPVGIGWPLVLLADGLVERDDSVWWPAACRIPSPVWLRSSPMKGGAL